jgi:hypothetical protein
VGNVGGSKYWQDVKGWSGGGLPWCAIFCSDALKQTNTPCNYFPSTVAFDARDKSVIGSALVNRYSLQPGDMVSFDWDGDGGGDHVGIVEKVLGDGVYQTIEGNVSNSVGRRTRYASNILFGIRPRYDAEKVELADLPLLKKGSEGDAVTALQLLLQLRGVVKFGKVDGVFGERTEKAVKELQQARGIYPDGKVGAKTWPALTSK